MHMADPFISPQVGLVMLAVSAGTIGHAVRRVKQDFREEGVPLMAVMGAFVFAAQMVNFVIPGTGSTGHITGAVLLAALLGPYAAFLALSCVLILQALFFADGGLLALGCNIFNMAFMGCLLAYPLIFRPLLKKGYSKPGLLAAAVVTCMVSAQLGALGVVLQTLVSGVTALPFKTFVLLMQPIHLAIGAVEGLLTALVLMVIRQAEPELFHLNADRQKIASRTLMVWICAVTLMMGGGLSLLASAGPDGLEWAVERTAGKTELDADGPAYAVAADLQAKSSFLPDYNLPDSQNEFLGTSISGLFGSVLTVLVLSGLGFTLRKRKKHVEIKQL